MAERCVFTLSEQDADALAKALTTYCGDVQVMVEHWPSQRTTVAVKGGRVWGPPIDVSEFRYEVDREPEYAAEMERLRYAASKRCDAHDWPRKAS